MSNLEYFLSVPRDAVAFWRKKKLPFIKYTDWVVVQASKGDRELRRAQITEKVTS